MTILLLLFLCATLFILDSFLLHFTTRIIFKIQKIKFTTSLVVNFFMYLLDIIFGAIVLISYFNWDQIISFDKIAVSLFYTSINPVPINILIAIIFLVVSLVIFYFLLKKYYSLKSFKNIGTITIVVILSIVLSSIFTASIKQFIVQPFSVKGNSMEPSLVNNEYFFAKMRDRNYQREDIVVFRNPKKQRQHFIERIIGLPNEKIQIKNGQIFLYNQDYPDGMVLSESYLPLGTKTKSVNNDIIELKENEYFILGDNRTNSYDSREIGPVSENLIIAKYWFSPFKNIE